MATCNPIYSVKPTEDDVPGAKLTKDLCQLSMLELKRWLECRALPIAGNKSQLVQRCMNCIDAGKHNDIHIAVDGGKWYAKKVQKVLDSSKDKQSPVKPIPLMPITGWKKFPSGPIPKDFCYGIIYEHIITTARIYDADDRQLHDQENIADFNTTKPMSKGRQYFLSGHVTNIYDQRKESFYFVKASVMASYTQNQLYNVSVTLDTSDAKVVDASCDCKASAMGRCNHVAALLFAVEDYTVQFGFDKPACTSQLCQWNVGRKKNKNPQPAHTPKYNKKTSPDRILKHDPRPVVSQTTTADEQFINNFIATLPNTGQESMFSQLLEIQYNDYVVDKTQLRETVEWALSQQQVSTESGPKEVPGTRNQADSVAWHQARFCRVTASVAKDVVITKSERGLFNILNQNLWGQGRREFSSMLYGRQHEHDAFKEYASKFIDSESEILSKTGFWINPQYPELGCSPDALITEKDGKIKRIVEIKCPSTLKNIDPLDIEDKLSQSQKRTCCYTVKNGVTCLRKAHAYHYQVQMQMAVCDIDFCDFVIWSPKGMSVETITRDHEFWNTLYPKLVWYYKNVLLPEYFEMRVPRKLLPVIL